MTGWGNGVYDFDNDGWKDFFVARANVMDNIQQAIPARPTRSPTRSSAISAMANSRTSSPSAGPDFQIAGATSRRRLWRHLQHGRIDAVVSSLNEPIKLFRNNGACRAATGFSCA